MASEGPFVVKKSSLLRGHKNDNDSGGQPTATTPAAAATAAEVATRDSVTEEFHDDTKKKKKKRKRSRDEEAPTTTSSSMGRKRKREDNATSSRGKAKADDGDNNDNDDKEEPQPKKKRKKSKKEKQRSSSVDSQPPLEGDTTSVAPTTTGETTTPPPPSASQRKKPDKDTTKRSKKSDKKNKASSSKTSPKKKNGSSSVSDAKQAEGAEAPSEDEVLHDHKHDLDEEACETPRHETPRSARKKKNAKKADQGISSVVDTPVDVDAPAAKAALPDTPEHTTAAAKANTESSTKKKGTTTKRRRRNPLGVKQGILNCTAALQVEAEIPGMPVSRKLVVEWVGAEKKYSQKILCAMKKNHLIDYDANSIWILPEGEEMAQPWDLPEDKPPTDEEEVGRDISTAEEKSDNAADASDAAPVADTPTAAGKVDDMSELVAPTNNEDGRSDTARREDQTATATAPTQRMDGRSDTARREDQTATVTAPTQRMDGRSDTARREDQTATVAAPTQRMVAQVRAGDYDQQSQAVTARAELSGNLRQITALTAGSRDLSQQVLLQFPWTTEGSSRCRPLRKTIGRNDGTVEEALYRILTRDVPEKHWKIFGSQYAPGEPRFFIQCGSHPVFMVDMTSELLPAIPRTSQELYEAVSFSFYVLARDGSELAVSDNMAIATTGNNAGPPKYKVAFERGLRYAADLASLAGTFQVGSIGETEEQN